jgi:predicted RNA-binding Zn ribbon-like protein
LEHDFGKQVGGRLCLDFTNTVRGRIGHPGSGRTRDYADRVVGERLISYEALLRWGAISGALTEGEVDALERVAAEKPEEAVAVLVRSLALREALYRVFKAVVEGWTPETEDLDVLNAELRVARARERLVSTPLLGWEWDASPMTLDRVLWPVVSSAAELLTGPDLERVGQCPGTECGWLFLDASRSRRRRWCDMADCGNRAKVHRFRRRHSGEG